MKSVFVGLGRMGSRMAGRILDAGLPLELYNRDPAKTKPFLERAKVHLDLNSALAGADVVFTMLSDDDALRSVISEETLKLAAPEAVHVSMSSVSLEVTRELSFLAKKLGRTHLSSPVFGRPAAAEAGTLFLCVAGEKEAKAKALKHLEAMGKVRDFGENPLAANAVKIAGNLMISSLIESFSEAFALTGKNGADPGAFYELMTEGLFNAPVAKLYGKLILDKDYDAPGFTAALGAKDVGLAKAAGEDSKVSLPLASLLAERFRKVLAKGWGNKDWTVVAELAKEDDSSDDPTP
ncbi:MAG: NAD(P)-dependent oxidoreductase [Deltaproteobacteria bacterium]|jgi:3-hydroxyisobutyrate dehydrogenase-like beta-hydroxyacid dehydrogenase|nr:NAD(P)-dependent oxidoreductase [Deltaproteobacteria bacterium]